MSLTWLRPPAPVTPVPVLVIVLAVVSSASSRYSCPGSRYCPCRGFVPQLPLLLSLFSLLSLSWFRPSAPVTAVPVLVIVLVVVSSLSSRYCCPGSRYCPCRGFVPQLPLLLSWFSLLSLPWLRPPAPVTPVPILVIVLVVHVASFLSSRYSCPGSRYCPCRGFASAPVTLVRFSLLSLSWLRHSAPVTPVLILVIVFVVASSLSSRYSCPGSRYCPYRGFVPRSRYSCPGSRFYPCRGFVLQLPLLLSRFSLLPLPWLRPSAPVTPVPALVIVFVVASSLSSRYSCPGSRYCPCRGFVPQLPLLLSRFSLLFLPWLCHPAPVTPVPALVIVLVVASSLSSRYSCPGSRFCPCRGFVPQLPLHLSRFSLLSLSWFRPPAPVTPVPVLVIVLAVASSSSSRYSCPGSRYCPCRGFACPPAPLLLSRFSLLPLPWLRPPAPVTPVPVLVIVLVVASSLSSRYSCPVLVIVLVVVSSASSRYSCSGSRYCHCRGFVLQLPLPLSRFSLLPLPWLCPPAPVTPVPVLVIVLAVALFSSSRYSCPGSRYCSCRGFVPQLLLLLSRFSLLSLPWLRPSAPVTPVPVLVIVLDVASSSSSRYSCPGSRYCPCRGFVLQLPLLLSRFSFIALAVASSSSSRYSCLAGSRYCPCRGFVPQLPLLLSRFSLLSLPWLRPPAPVAPVPVLVIALAVDSSPSSCYSCPGSHYCPCRGFVLQLPLLLSRFSSPLPYVLTHYETYKLYSK